MPGTTTRAALVVPAAGSGERLGLGIPKALADLGGRPMLAVTVSRLLEAAAFEDVVVLAPPDALRPFAEALAAVDARIRVLPGGGTRQQSVALGTAALAPGIDVACVHDAARPLVAAATVRQVIEAAAAGGAATAASRPADSVRAEVEAGVTTALDRARLWMVETPQAFRLGLLKRAHDEAARAGREYTDDASLVEALGERITIVATQGRNLKVTLEADLALATLLLRAGDAAPPRP